MSSCSIKNIEDLFKEFTKNKKLLKYEIKKAGLPDDNHNGGMLRLEITFRDFGKVQTIHAFAKTPNFELKECFKDQISIQFKKEIGFYKNVVPTLEWFYEYEGYEKFPDIFPELLGGRLSLTEDFEEVDENAVIVMEDLVEQGYKNINRHVGFNLEGTKSLLRDLAKFHALPLALKLNKLHLFEIKIKKWADLQSNLEPPVIDNNPNSSPMQVWIDVLKADVPEKYLDVIRKLDSGPRSEPREPFATLGHNDLRTNNIMRVIKNRNIVKNKILDFQKISYQSPVKDLLFFLTTSVQFEVLEGHLDELIKYYHQQFLYVLEICNCNKEKFGWEYFKKELELEAGKELRHIIMYIPVVFGDKSDGVGDNDNEKVIYKFDASKISKLAKERVIKVLQIYERNGWITII